MAKRCYPSGRDNIFHLENAYGKSGMGHDCITSCKVVSILCRVLWSSALSLWGFFRENLGPALQTPLIRTTFSISPFRLGCWKNHGFLQQLEVQVSHPFTAFIHLYHPISSWRMLPIVQKVWSLFCSTVGLVWIYYVPRKSKKPPLGLWCWIQVLVRYSYIEFLIITNPWATRVPKIRENAKLVS